MAKPPKDEQEDQKVALGRDEGGWTGSTSTCCARKTKRSRREKRRRSEISPPTEKSHKGTGSDLSALIKVTHRGGSRLEAGKSGRARHAKDLPLVGGKKCEPREFGEKICCQKLGFLGLGHDAGTGKGREDSVNR